MKLESKQNGAVGIIGAMESEIALLRDVLQDAKEESIGGMILFTGRIAETDVVVAKCGVGKVNAALCAQIMIDRFSVSCLINTGVAGGIGAKGTLAVGDFVIGTEAIQHDFDLTAFGHAKGYLCTGIHKDKPTIFCSDPRLVEALDRAAIKYIPPSKLKHGRIATGDTFVSNSAMKEHLWATFQASAVEMEGAAIAQTATACGVPFVIARSISDLADGSAAESFEAFEQEVARISASIVTELLRTEFRRWQNGELS